MNRKVFRTQLSLFEQEPAYQEDSKKGMGGLLKGSEICHVIADFLKIISISGNRFSGKSWLFRFYNLS